MYVPMKAGHPGSSLDDLIGPLLGDMDTLAGWEHVVRPKFLGIKQDGADQAVLDVRRPLPTSFPKDPESVTFQRPLA